MKFYNRTILKIIPAIVGVALLAGSYLYYEFSVNHNFTPNISASSTLPMVEIGSNSKDVVSDINIDDLNAQSFDKLKINPVKVIDPSQDKDLLSELKGVKDQYVPATIFEFNSIPAQVSNLKLSLNLSESKPVLKTDYSESTKLMKLVLEGGAVDVNGRLSSYDDIVVAEYDLSDLLESPEKTLNSENSETDLAMLDAPDADEKEEISIKIGNTEYLASNLHNNYIDYSDYARDRVSKENNMEVITALKEDVVLIDSIDNENTNIVINFAPQDFEVISSEYNQSYNGMWSFNLQTCEDNSKYLDVEVRSDSLYQNGFQNCVRFDSKNKINSNYSYHSDIEYNPLDPTINNSFGVIFRSGELEPVYSTDSDQSKHDDDKYTFDEKLIKDTSGYQPVNFTYIPDSNTNSKYNFTFYVNTKNNVLTNQPKISFDRINISRSFSVNSGLSLIYENDSESETFNFKSLEYNKINNKYTVLRVNGASSALFINLAGEYKGSSLILNKASFQDEGEELSSERNISSDNIFRESQYNDIIKMYESGYLTQLGDKFIGKMVKRTILNHNIGLNKNNTIKIPESNMMISSASSASWLLDSSLICQNNSDYCKDGVDGGYNFELIVENSSSSNNKILNIAAFGLILLTIALLISKQIARIALNVFPDLNR